MLKEELNDKGQQVYKLPTGLGGWTCIGKKGAMTQKTATLAERGL